MAPHRESSLFLRLIGLVALLSVLSSPASAQFRGFGVNKVRYDDFDWTIYHSPHFDVYSYPKEEQLLKKVVSFAESAYDELSRGFDFQIQEPTPLIFYATHSEFEQNNVILNFIPEGVLAFASPVRNRMVMPVDLPDPELYRLILHELTHVFQYHILFQGSLSKAATANPPQWVMEGMASYMANDEDAYAKMVLRDYVVNDIIPSVENPGVSGYFAYRFGHAVFDYIEERWGKEGFRDFLYEFRNTLGGRVGRAIQRTFRMDVEDFDVEFRRWLRKKYLRQLIETGEPGDFGRPLLVEDDPNTDEMSGVASPSGDLIASFSIQRGDLDIVLFDSNKRRQIRNLTRGVSTQYRYLVSQAITVAPSMGRDLAFSPDGNYLAAFARLDEGRALLLFDVVHGGLARKIEMDVEQQVGLAWSPDGATIAFSGNRNGVFDIYLLNLETKEITQLTNDPVFDGGPTFSPDGKSLVFTSVVGESAKLFRMDLANPNERFQLTSGDSHDRDPIYSSDGKRIYYTSEREAYSNIFALELATGEIRQYTNAVTGCFLPAVVPRPEGRESLVYGGLWKGSRKLYLTDLEQAIGEPQKVAVNPAPQAPGQLAAFEPAIEVNVDENNKEKYNSRRFFLADAQTLFGVDNNQTILGTIFLTFSDYLGDKQINAILSSYDALSNFNISYTDLSHRWQWTARVFDYRDFLFVAQDPATGQILDRRNEIRITGAAGEIAYPFSIYSRVEGGAGYVFRKQDFDRLVQNPDGSVGFRTDTLKDDYPYFFLGLVHDNTRYGAGGVPISGQRWRLDGEWAPDIDRGGTLTSEISGDFRQYFATSQRTGFALRLFAGGRFGSQPTPFYIGGESIRGFRFRELTGDRAFFTTAEYRFPLIDVLATPILRFQGIRGRVFLDVGGVWYHDLGVLDFREDGSPFFRDYKFWDSDNNVLRDGVSVYGFGFTVRFLGLDLNWDFGKRWNFKDSLSGYETTFIIGSRF